MYVGVYYVPTLLLCIAELVAGTLHIVYDRCRLLLLLIVNVEVVRRRYPTSRYRYIKILHTTSLYTEWAMNGLLPTRATITICYQHINNESSCFYPLRFVPIPKFQARQSMLQKELTVFFDCPKYHDLLLESNFFLFFFVLD